VTDPRPYSARITRWVDGDTFDAQVIVEAKLMDVGFHVEVLSQGAQFKIRFRLFDYEAPEDSGPERSMGLIATQAARLLAPEGHVYLIHSYKVPEKYGRWLARVTRPSGRDLAEELVWLEYGQRWNGQGPRPIFDVAKYPSTLVAVGGVDVPS